MKTLKKNLFIPFVLGIMLSVIIACNDESGSGTALTLSSYEGKVKIGDMASVQISLSDPESFSKIVVKKSISGKEVVDYKKELNVKDIEFPYTFREEVVAGDETGVVVYSFYGMNANNLLVDASDLVLTVDLAEVPLLLKYDWKLVQQIIQGEDWATPDLKDDVYRFNPDLTLEWDWGTVFSAIGLEKLNACCSWDVDQVGAKVEYLYMVKYSVFNTASPMITKYKVVQLADRKMILESHQNLAGLGPDFSTDEVVMETYEPVSKTDDFTPYRGELDGKFTLSVSDKAVIEISFVGYETQEIKMNTSKTDFKIVLRDDAELLEEVVVVGYGVQKKSDLTSAVATVKSDELAATSVTSLDQGLQGRAAGVVVLNTSGQPGAGTSIRIRGTSSINGNNEPLYVIDGIPVISDASSFSTGALQNPALNPLTNINPNDIESIEILKDASATSIYGARGANGVVLVTTKQGKSGKPKVSIGAKFTLQQVTKKMDMLNSVQLAELANEVADNDGVERNPVFAGLNNLSKINTDWQDEIFRTAPMQNYDISVSGGNDKTTYFISGNLLLQDGIIIGSDFGKGSFRVNLNQQINKWLKAGISTNLSYSRSNGVVTNAEGGFASSVTSWALEMNPGLPVRDSEGNYTYENNMKSPNVGNPVQDALEAKNRNTSFRTLANAFLEYMPIKDLTFKTSIGVDYFYIKDQSFGAGELKRAESNGGYANIGNRDGYNWVWENTVNYNQTFGDHTLGVLGGMTAQAFVSENSSVSTADFEDGFLGFNSIQSGALRQAANSGIAEWQMLSYLARINYGYKGRYLLTLTGRVDGSSKFGKGNKYGFFPSVAGAWRVSEENFMKEMKAVSNLKLRASYGICC